MKKGERWLMKKYGLKYVIFRRLYIVLVDIKWRVYCSKILSREIVYKIIGGLSRMIDYTDDVMLETSVKHLNSKKSS